MKKKEEKNTWGMEKEKEKENMQRMEKKNLWGKP
jgi:hypothetical protein